MRSVQKPTDEAATLRDEWERGFGTKKAASTEGQGVTWALCGTCCLGRAGWALRERTMGVEGAGRAPPWRQLRTDRKGQVSRVGKRRQVLNVAKKGVCEGATQ